ncbi:MAG: hypothetical protein ACPIOQ_49385 [Promethearchaeia archaeon]
MGRAAAGLYTVTVSQIRPPQKGGRHPAVNPEKNTSKNGLNQTYMYICARSSASARPRMAAKSTPLKLHACWPKDGVDAEATGSKI